MIGRAGLHGRRVKAISVWLFLSSLAGLNAAPAVGLFSGVSAHNITATPNLRREVVFTATGQALAALGQGMAHGEKDGETVVTTKDGFGLEFAKDLAPGRYSLEVRSVAPNVGSDSLWVAVDGKQLDQSFGLPTGKLDNRSLVLTVTGSGKHAFRLTLREKPGCAIAGVTLYGMASKPPVAELRSELRGQHPRLLLTRDSLPGLQARLTDARVQRFYVLAPALTRKPPAYKPGARNGGGFRRLPAYALSQLLAPQPEKLQGMLSWLETATTYTDCGVDLDAEYFMEGVALAYDWLYDQIPPPLRARVRDTIARQGRLVYEASLAGRSGGGHHFQQNHYWYSHLSLALAAGAVHGEVPEASQWLAWAWDRYERIPLTFSPDGSFHEGPGYWSFSMPALYLYTDLYEWCTGRRIPAGDDGLAGQGEFRWHHQYPGLQHTAALEDTTAGKGSVPIETLLWETKRFKAPGPMGIAHRLRREPDSNAWNFLWLDENVPAADVRQTVPRSRYYQDVETAFARTSWDDDASYVAFVSRPLGGHRWSEFCDKFKLGGTGHNHPEQNHFILFGRGEVLAGDTGYTYKKQTRDHNTVLVDGKGQYGDGEMWPNPKPGRAHITRFVTRDDVTIVTGDATSAYPPELGLTQFERTLVLAGPDLAVVNDRLTANQPRTFSWLLHHYGQSSRDGGEWRIVRNQAQLGVVPLLPRRLAAQETVYRPSYIHPTRSVAPAEPDVHLLELKTEPSRETSFLVPLLIARAGEKLPAAVDVSNPTCEAVRVGDTVVAFNRGKGRMRVELPWGENVETEAACLVARMKGATREIVQAPAETVKH